MEYEVCIFVEKPPQYLKFYKTLEDYKRCNVIKIAVIGSKHSKRDREQYRTLKQIYNDIDVIFVDKNREKDKAEELIETCINAKHTHFRVVW
jgi:predicted CoA-binding protein